MSDFVLDTRLEGDSLPVVRLALCELRLSKDARWPWLVLVPRRPGISEIFELTPLDQIMLTFEMETVAAALKKATGATKINIGALGNIVRQLHVHVIARFESDLAWPGPVWGFGQATAYDPAQQNHMIAIVREALMP